MADKLKDKEELVLKGLNIGPKLKRAILWEFKEFPLAEGAKLTYKEAGERLVHLMLIHRIIPISSFKDIPEVWDSPYYSHLKINNLE